MRGLLTLLTIIGFFVTSILGLLKILGFMSITWTQVIYPLGIPLLLSFVILLIMTVFWFVTGFIEEYKKQKENQDKENNY